MHHARKPTWQQATALVSLSTCGAMTGFAFAHGTVGEMTSPTRIPVNLMALKKAAIPAASSQPSRAMSASEKAMRAAVVKVARYYLRMAQSKSPAEMEALIWGQDSVDGVNHGQSCAAFASLTLALGAQATGQQSWVTGGTTYPWPLHQWADVRVDTNPDSPQITSVMQDAQASHRWHPLGDGYRPQPGDWVLFEGHVEVVTKYSGGVLYTIGGDSAPNLSVNAHTFTGPLAGQGVTGFVNNGDLAGASPAGSSTSASSTSASSGASGGVAQAVTAGIVEQGTPATAGAGGAVVPGTGTAVLATAGKGATRMAGTAGRTQSTGTAGLATVPGLMADMAAGGSAAKAAPAAPQSRAKAPKAQAARGQGRGGAARSGGAGRSGGKAQTAARTQNNARTQGAAGTQAGGGAAIPGLEPTSAGLAAPDGAARAASTASTSSTPAAPSYTRNNPPTPAAHVPDTSSQQAFISAIAPGAIAAQSRYGVPASVTIAQAIDESGWGQSALAIRDHNLFGIKGSGPAGSDALPTREYENGNWVTVTAQFRVYHNVAQSIADHSELLATGPSYQHAMASRHHADAFASNLTGVYATDPEYGSNLITIMKLYNLYRYDAATAAPAPAAPTSPAAASTPASTPLVGTLPASTGPASTGPASTGPASTGPASSATLSQPVVPGVAFPGAPTHSAAASQTASPVASPTAASPTAVSSSAAAPSTPAPSAASPAAAPSAAAPAPTPRASASAAPASAAAASSGHGRPSGRSQPSERQPAGRQPSGRSQASPRSQASGRVQPPARSQASGRVQPPARSQPSGYGQASGYGRASGQGQGGTAGGVHGTATIPGVLDAYGTASGRQAPTAAGAMAGAVLAGSGLTRAGAARRRAERPAARVARVAPRRPRPVRYVPQLPEAVTAAFAATAKAPLSLAEPLYDEVADYTGIRWELLAACDWMQCQARPRYSPVYGEKLGTVNAGGTVYRTKSEALTQCAADLVELAMAVYWIDITARRPLSVRELAQVFAAFRWGGLLKLHDISAMEFPYSVEGLTAQQVKMRWPDIKDPNAPDKPGTRFRQPFGAVPVVLSLGYAAAA